MRRNNAGSHTKQVTHFKQCFHAEFITRAEEARMQTLLSLCYKQRFGYGEQELIPRRFFLLLLSCSPASRCVHNPAVGSEGFGVEGAEGCGAISRCPQPLGGLGHHSRVLAACSVLAVNPKQNK